MVPDGYDLVPSILTSFSEMHKRWNICVKCVVKTSILTSFSEIIYAGKSKGDGKKGGLPY